MSGNNNTKKGYDAANSLADKGRYNFGESYKDLQKARHGLRTSRKESEKKLLEKAFTTLNNYHSSEDRKASKSQTAVTIFSILNLVISIIGGFAVYKTLKDTPVFEKTNGYYSGHSNGTHFGNGSGDMDAYGLVSTLINLYHEKAAVHFDATFATGQISGSDLTLSNDWNKTGKIISALNSSNSKLYFNFDGVQSSDGNGYFVLTGAALKQFLGGLKFNYSRDAVVDYDTGAVPLQGHADMDFSGISDWRQYIVDLQGLSMDGNLEGHCEMDASRSALEILASPLAPRGNVSITYDVPSMDGKITLDFNQTEWEYIKAASQLVYKFSYNGSDDSAMSGTTEFNGNLSDPMCAIGGLLSSLGIYTAVSSTLGLRLTDRGQNRLKHSLRKKAIKFISDVSKLYARNTEKQVSTTDAAVIATLSSGTELPTQKIDGKGLREVSVKRNKDTSKKRFSKPNEAGWGFEESDNPAEENGRMPVYDLDEESKGGPVGSELPVNDAGDTVQKTAQKPAAKPRYDTRTWAEKWGDKSDNKNIEQELDDAIDESNKGSSSFDEQPAGSD